MSWYEGVAARVRSWVGRRAAEERMEEEIRFHIEMETEANVRRGLSAAEARRRALVAFGGAEAHREELRAGRRLPLVEDLWSDARYAGRSLGRARGFAAVAVLTLGVGIGAATAMYGVLRGVLLRPLPVQAEAELVVAWARAPERGTDRLPLAYGELRGFEEGSRLFAGVAGVAFQGSLERVLVDGDRPVVVGTTWVTGDFFPVLGVVPVLGRTLLPADDRPGAEPVMVIGHEFWQRHFGGSAAVVGRVLEWQGTAYRVVGVLPRGFEYPAQVEAWTPVLPDFPRTLEAAAGPAEVLVFHLVGRLAPGVEPESARAELAAYLRATDTARPEALRGQEPVVTPLAEVVVGEVRGLVWASAAAVALLLLIACVNVANLLLIRGSARGQELAIRSALGAGRRRLVRQLLTETGVLAAAGGILGVALALLAVQALVGIAPPELPRRELIGVDGGVLVAAVVITGAAALVAGLLPALFSAAGSVSARLRGGQRTAGVGRGEQAVRHGLVVGQVALAVLVVVAAGLLVRSLQELQRVELGFTADRLLVLQTMLPPEALPERAQRVALQEAVVERIAALPGVASAAALPGRPFAGQGGWTAMYTGEGQTPEAQGTNPWVSFEVVGPGYFQTLQIPLVRGRPIGPADREEAAPVAVVSEAVARHTWPGEDPLGQRIKLGSPGGPGTWHAVVGVVGETRYRELAEPQPSLYLPIRQFGGPVPMALAVRTAEGGAALLPTIRRALAEAHPELLLVSGGTLREHMAAPLARPRFSALLLGVFAAVTLLLAVVGIYGALAAAVRQRTRELGIRLALGARTGEVRGLVLRRGVGLALLGSALGFAAASLATGVLRGLLFGVGPVDLPTFAAVAALVLGAAVLASLVPAWQAGRVDPVHALRE
jgi:putative ABC transport system permease protein